MRATSRPEHAATEGDGVRSRTSRPSVYAHATGESRQAALDELATLIADADPGREQRANESVWPTQQNHAGGVLDRGWHQSGLRRLRLAAAGYGP